MPQPDGRLGRGDIEQETLGLVGEVVPLRTGNDDTNLTISAECRAGNVKPGVSDHDAPAQWPFRCRIAQRQVEQHAQVSRLADSFQRFGDPLISRERSPTESFILTHRNAGRSLGSSVSSKALTTRDGSLPSDNSASAMTSARSFRQPRSRASSSAGDSTGTFTSRMAHDHDVTHISR